MCDVLQVQEIEEFNSNYYKSQKYIYKVSKNQVIREDYKGIRNARRMVKKEVD